MMNKRKTGSETLAAFEEHLNEVTFSNLRKQATFCNAFISSPAKWFLGMKFLCLFLRHHFMGKLLVVLQNVGCFFFRTDFQWLQGLKKTWSSFCPSDKQLSNFPHPERLPILLNIFCVYVATWILTHCVDKWGLDLTFSEVKFTCMKMDENFSSCAPVFNKAVLWIL